MEELDYVKAKYKREIKINTGFEIDYIEGYEAKTKKMLNRYSNS